MESKGHLREWCNFHQRKPAIPVQRKLKKTKKPKKKKRKRRNEIKSLNVSLADELQIHQAYTPNPLSQSANPVELPPIFTPDISHYQQLRLLKESKTPQHLPGSVRTKTHYIGNAGKLELLGNYKNLTRILDRNDYYKTSNSPMVDYLNMIRDNKMPPKGWGLIKNRGSPESVDLQHYSVGDKYLNILTKGIKRIDIKVLNLDNNRLTDEGVKNLLENINFRKLEVLDLSNNVLTYISYEGIAEALQNSKLQVLRLEGLGITDRESGIFADALGFSAVQELNLARNKLVKPKELSEFLEYSRYIQKLDLHWNYIRGPGSKTLAKGLGENESLKIVDLSWNAMGSPAISSGAPFISKALKNHPSIFHLDLSHNGFSEKDAKVLSEGLESNHTIMGIHMEGNHSLVDPLGFVESKEWENITQAHIFTRILWNSRIKDHLLWRKTSNCWICEKWKEVEFKFVSTKPGRVFLHLEFEDYEPDMMDQKNTGEFSLTRMCPPGKVRFFFTEGKVSSPSAEYPIEQIRPSIDLEILLWVDNPVHIVLDQVNVLKNEYGPNLLKIDTEKITKPRIPRRRFEPHIAAKEWGIPISIFKDYVFDKPELLKRCFEADMRNGKIRKLVKDEVEFNNVLDILWKYYEAFKESYKHYSSMSPQGDIWAIGQMALTEFCNETKLFDSNLKLADLDFHLKGALYTGVKNPRNPSNALIRYEFLEILVRIALDKFLKTGMVQTADEAVEKLYEEQLLRGMEKYSADKWRFERLLNEECDYVFKKNIKLIKAVYKCYSKKKVKPSQKPFMCLDEFTEICVHGNLLTEHFTTREIPFAFNLSMITEPNELSSDRHLQMSLIEFIEALGRVADIGKTPPIDQKDKIEPNLHLSEYLMNLMSYLKEVLPYSLKREFK